MLLGTGRSTFQNKDCRIILGMSVRADTAQPGTCRWGGGTKSAMAQYAEGKAEFGVCRNGGGTYGAEIIWEGEGLGMHRCRLRVPQGW